MFWFKPIVSAPSRTTKQTLIAATFFSIEVGTAALLISLIYSFMANAAGVTWAIVSAILVLYPGITQSISAAFLRIAANLLGCAVGFGVGTLAGINTVEIVLSLVITIFIGEFLRMDLALRTACVASVIVMNANDHNLGLSVVERVAAVLIGCGVALAVQVSAFPLRRFLPFVAKVEVTAKAPAADTQRERPRIVTE